MSYAQDTEYAAKHLVELAFTEDAKLAALRAEYMPLVQRTQVFQRDFQTSELNEDFSEGYVMAAFHRAAVAHRDMTNARDQMAVLEASIGARQVALQALAGALLQIAKQGISLVHGSLAAAPDGRTIDGLKLKDIVWQGRNQAIHYEDGGFSQAVVAVFQSLESQHGAQFSLTQHARTSLARQITALLGWQSYVNYRHDMSLLGLG